MARSARVALLESLEQRRLLCMDHLIGDAELSVLPLPALEAESESPATSTRGTRANQPLSSLPQLSSRPGSPRKLFLDFNGDNIPNWGTNNSASPVQPYHPGVIPAYDADGDATTYSDAERTNINRIWQHVAEKFSPFDVDVTTVDPGNRTDGVTFAMVIGGTNAWLGSGGGTAYVNSFTNARDNIGFVFSQGRANDITFIGSGAAHEFGHAFGLEHQGVNNGNMVTTEYWSGNGTIVPIMGNANNTAAPRGIWHNGQANKRDNNNNLVTLPNQDDLAIMTDGHNNWGYRPDDFGDFSGSGSLSQNPQTGAASGAGVIERNGDRDAFTFTAIGPVVSFTVNNAAEGGMLAPWLEVIPLGSGGNPTWSLTTTNTSATISTSNAVPGGGYVLRVSPQSNAYGNLGQYTISGNLGVFASLNAGRITITGYNTNNDIMISYHSSTNEIVLQNDVYGGSAVQRWPRSMVNSIVVNAQGGNDFIDVFGQFSVLSIPITVNGGGGDDYLIFQGTTGNDLQVLETASFGRNNNTPVTFGGIEKLIMTAFDGNDIQRIRTIPANLSVTVYGGGHDDGFDLSDVNGNVETIQGSLHYSGDGGYDTFVVQNGYATGNWYHTIGSTYIGNYKDGFTQETTVSGLERVIIGASENNDSVWASPFANFSYVMYGRGGNDSFDIQGGNSAQLFGGNGDDRFYFGGGNLGPAISSVYAYGEAGNDVMVLDDRNSTHNFPWAVYGNSGDQYANTVFLGLNAYTYNGFEGVEVLAGNGNNDFQILGSSVPVTLRGGGGNDQFRFLQTTQGIVDMTLDGQGGFDVLIADDRNFQAGISIMELSESYLRRWAGWGIFAVPYTSNYSAIESLTYYAHANATTTYVYGTSSSVPAGQQYTLLLGNNADTVLVYPQNSAGNLTINGNLGISGGGGVDSIYVTSASAPNPMSYSFSNTFGSGTQNIYGVGAAGLGTAGIENITVQGGAADDTFYINQYTSGTALAINGGAGNDTVNYGSNTMANITSMSYFSFNGEAGYDTFNVNNQVQNVGFTYTRNTNVLTASGTNGAYYQLNESNNELIRFNGGPQTDNLYVYTVATGAAVEFNGGAGIDGLVLGGGNHSVDGIRGQIVYNGQADGGNMLLSDIADTSGDIVHLTANSIGAYPGDTLFGPGGSLLFSGVVNYLTNPGITLNLGSGADTVYAQPLASARVTITAGNPTTAPGDSLNLALAAAQNAVVTGTPASGNLTSSNLQTLNWTGFEQSLATDAIAPAVVVADININGIPGPARTNAYRQSVDVRFSEDVSALIGPHSLVLTNLTTGQNVPSANIAVSYDQATHTAHFTFPGYANGVLPDGEYRGRLLAGLPDFFGNALSADVTFDFFILAGDANHDRKVDVADLGIFASNWQQTGRTFSQGDFNYDGTVDVADLGILASNWQGSVPMPSLPVASQTPPKRTFSPISMAEII